MSHKPNVFRIPHVEQKGKGHWMHNSDVTSTLNCAFDKPCFVSFVLFYVGSDNYLFAKSECFVDVKWFIEWPIKSNIKWYLTLGKLQQLIKQHSSGTAAAAAAAAAAAMV